MDVLKIEQRGLGQKCRKSTIGGKGLWVRKSDRTKSNQKQRAAQTNTATPPPHTHIKHNVIICCSLDDDCVESVFLMMILNCCPSSLGWKWAIEQQPPKWFKHALLGSMTVSRATLHYSRHFKPRFFCCCHIRAIHRHSTQNSGTFCNECFNEIRVRGKLCVIFTSNACSKKKRILTRERAKN